MFDTQEVCTPSLQMPLYIFLLDLLEKSLPHQKCCVLAGFVHLLIAEGRVVRWLVTRNMSQTWQQIKLIHHFLTRSLAGCRLLWLISIPWSALLLHMPPPMMDQSSFLRLRPGFDLFWLEIFFGNSPSTFMSQSAELTCLTILLLTCFVQPLPSYIELSDVEWFLLESDVRRLTYSFPLL